MTIVEFLLACIAEDEDDADRILYDHGGMNFEPRAARVLAECEAKRRIVEIAAAQIRLGDEAAVWENWRDMAQQILRALASVYADHPDFRPEWRLTSWTG